METLLIRQKAEKKKFIKQRKKIMARKKPKIRRQKFKQIKINLKGLHLFSKNGYQSGYRKTPAIYVLQDSQLKQNQKIKFEYKGIKKMYHVIIIKRNLVQQYFYQTKQNLR